MSDKCGRQTNTKGDIPFWESGSNLIHSSVEIRYELTCTIWVQDTGSGRDDLRKELVGQ